MLVCVLALALLATVGVTPSIAGSEDVGPLYDDLPLASGTSYTTLSRWNHRDLTYAFANGTTDIAADAERQAVRDAFALWSGVTPLTFDERSYAVGADIVIKWASGAHGDSSPFDGVNRVLAHAFIPGSGGDIAGDVHFDDAEVWTLSTRASGVQPIDLVSVAAHEIGHAIGLAHSGSTQALMYPYYSGSHRFLSADDVSGIQSLYGPRVCTIYRYGYRGEYICGTNNFELTWPDGRAQTFVIGTNSAVWNIVRNASGIVSGWKSLGGLARVGVYRNYVTSASNLGIVVYGTDGNPWCRNFVNGAWQSNWLRC